MRRLIRFWTDYARRFRWTYALGLVCLVATNVLTVSIPSFVQRAVDALGHGEGPRAATTWAFAVLAAGVGIVVVRTLSRTLFFNPGRTIEYRVKNDLFDRLLTLPRRFFDRMRPGEIVSRGTNDTNSMRALIGFGSLQVFNVALTLSLTLGKMFLAHVALTLLCVGPLLVAALILRVAVKAMFRLTVQVQAQVATLSDRILEAYNGVGVLQAFNALPGADARFDEANGRLLDLTLALVRVRSWLLPVVSVVGNLCVVILLYAGGRRVIEGTLTIGQLAAFAVYVNILVGGLTSLGWLVAAVQRGYVSLGRVYELLDQPVERPPVRAALPAPGPRGFGLEVRDLRFAHDGGPTVLDGVSFRVRPGETLGIFGLTGAGKSTLLDLVARVHEPPPGTVFLDGVDVRDVPVRDYWRAVAYVPQEPFLFSRTVRENIALAAGDEEIDEDRLRAAVEDAALAPDLEALVDGLDTVVGERGITLSGGQRQRTALARAFYRDFDLLLLDDVMSAVDHATEKRLIDAVYRRGGGRTTLIVSHRISALARADRIIVIDGGRVVAEGTHAELLERDGPYARAWRLQRAAEALEAERRDREEAARA